MSKTIDYFKTLIKVGGAHVKCMFLNYNYESPLNKRIMLVLYINFVHGASKASTRKYKIKFQLVEI